MQVNLTSLSQTQPGLSVVSNSGWVSSVSWAMMEQRCSRKGKEPFRAAFLLSPLHDAMAWSGPRWLISYHVHPASCSHGSSTWESLSSRKLGLMARMGAGKWSGAEWNPDPDLLKMGPFWPGTRLLCMPDHYPWHSHSILIEGALLHTPPFMFQVSSCMVETHTWTGPASEMGAQHSRSLH